MEIYHLLNRGVDRRTIFLDVQDKKRFVHGLEIFNDTAPANNTSYSIANIAASNDLRGRYGNKEDRQLVDIHAWVLMGNHYHLLVSERLENGVTKFITKLNVGYAKYFNEKYKRSGTLFQGRTKKILIAHQAQYLHILHYIHLNPLDMSPTTREWRLRRIQNAKKAISHLDRYKWSSYTDYCGKNNFPSLLTKELFAETYPDYKKELSAYLADIEHLPPELTLEG